MSTLKKSIKNNLYKRVISVHKIWDDSCHISLLESQQVYNLLHFQLQHMNLPQFTGLSWPRMVSWLDSLRVDSEVAYTRARGWKKVWLWQSKVTKINTDSVCTHAKTMLESIILNSGPPLCMTGVDLYSHTSSPHRWLSTNQSGLRR